VRLDSIDEVQDPRVDGVLVAARRPHEVGRAIEIDGLYCDAIIRRWQEMTGGEAILEETGETFAILEGQRLREGEV